MNDDKLMQRLAAIQASQDYLDGRTQALLCVVTQLLREIGAQNAPMAGRLEGAVAEWLQLARDSKDIPPAAKAAFAATQKQLVEALNPQPTTSH
jgi:hypothetical protein